jgi:Protein of unknown function (DUF3306)
MSEPDDGPENFLQRWSRRKQAAALRTGGQGGEAEPADAAKPEIESLPDGTTANPSDPPMFDPATLPPIESITATTDIRAFLAPGVPAELARAALRRAWTSDPAIREFIGIAENQWDFTKPDSVPGFGSLELTPELRRMVAQLVGDTPDAPPQQQPTPPQQQPSRPAREQIAETSVELVPPKTPGGAGGDAAAIQSVAPADKDAATQTETDADLGELSARRKHGSALPKIAESR